MPEDLQNIVNPIDGSASREEKVRQLQELSKENEPIVQKFLDEIDRKYGTESNFNHKSAENIAAKAKRPSILSQKPWHDVEHIRDSFRFKTILSDLEALPKIAEDLRESGITVVKVDTDKQLQPGPWGWRIAVFDLRMQNGQLVEYYCPVKELEQAKKDGNHKIFENWRTKDISQMSPKELDELYDAQEESSKKYDDAWKDYLDRTKQKPERVKELLEKTRENLQKDRIQEPERNAAEVKQPKSSFRKGLLERLQNDPARKSEKTRDKEIDRER